MTGKSLLEKKWQTHHSYIQKTKEQSSRLRSGDRSLEESPVGGITNAPAAHSSRTIVSQIDISCARREGTLVPWSRQRALYNAPECETAVQIESSFGGLAKRDALSAGFEICLS